MDTMMSILLASHCIFLVILLSLWSTHEVTSSFKEPKGNFYKPLHPKATSKSDLKSKKAKQENVDDPQSLEHTLHLNGLPAEEADAYNYYEASYLDPPIIQTTPTGDKQLIITIEPVANVAYHSSSSAVPGAVFNSKAIVGSEFIDHAAPVHQEAAFEPQTRTLKAGPGFDVRHINPDTGLPYGKPVGYPEATFEPQTRTLKAGPGFDVRHINPETGLPYGKPVGYLQPYPRVASPFVAPYYMNDENPVQPRPPTRVTYKGPFAPPSQSGPPPPRTYTPYLPKLPVAPPRPFQPPKAGTGTVSKINSVLSSKVQNNIVPSRPGPFKQGQVPWAPPPQGMGNSGWERPQASIEPSPPQNRDRAPGSPPQTSGPPPWQETRGPSTGFQPAGPQRPSQPNWKNEGDRPRQPPPRPADATSFKSGPQTQGQVSQQPQPPRTNQPPPPKPPVRPQQPGGRIGPPGFDQRPPVIISSNPADIAANWERAHNWPPPPIPRPPAKASSGPPPSAFGFNLNGGSAPKTGTRPFPSTTLWPNELTKPAQAGRATSGWEPSIRRPGPNAPVEKIHPSSQSQSSASWVPSIKTGGDVQHQGSSQSPRPVFSEAQPASYPQGLPRSYPQSLEGPPRSYPQSQSQSQGWGPPPSQSQSLQSHGPPGSFSQQPVPPRTQEAPAPRYPPGPPPSNSPEPYRQTYPPQESRYNPPPNFSQQGSSAGFSQAPPPTMTYPQGPPRGYPQSPPVEQSQARPPGYLPQSSQYPSPRNPLPPQNPQEYSRSTQPTFSFSQQPRPTSRPPIERPRPQYPQDQRGSSQQSFQSQTRQPYQPYPPQSMPQRPPQTWQPQPQQQWQPNPAELPWGERPSPSPYPPQSWPATTTKVASPGQRGPGPNSRPGFGESSSNSQLRGLEVQGAAPGWHQNGFQQQHQHGQHIQLPNTRPNIVNMEPGAPGNFAKPTESGTFWPHKTGNSNTNNNPPGRANHDWTPVYTKKGQGEPQKFHSINAFSSENGRGFNFGNEPVQIIGVNELNNGSFISTNSVPPPGWQHPLPMPTAGAWPTKSEPVTRPTPMSADWNPALPPPWALATPPPHFLPEFTWPEPTTPENGIDDSNQFEPENVPPPPQFTPGPISVHSLNQHHFHAVQPDSNFFEDGGHVTYYGDRENQPYRPVTRHIQNVEEASSFYSPSIPSPMQAGISAPEFQNNNVQEPEFEISASIHAPDPPEAVLKQSETKGLEKDQSDSSREFIDWKMKKQQIPGPSPSQADTLILIGSTYRSDQLKSSPLFGYNPLIPSSSTRAAYPVFHRMAPPTIPMFGKAVNGLYSGMSNQVPSYKPVPKLVPVTDQQTNSQVQQVLATAASQWLAFNTVPNSTALVVTPPPPAPAPQAVSPPTSWIPGQKKTLAQQRFEFLNGKDSSFSGTTPKESHTAPSETVLESLLRTLSNFEPDKKSTTSLRYR